MVTSQSWNPARGSITFRTRETRRSAFVRRTPPGDLTSGGLFTLVFEIGYAFLIWRPKLRWLFLGAAIILHGGIGLFMGLKTFSLMMLVMNMVFLRKEEAVWIFTTPFSLFQSAPAKAVPQPAAATAK